METQENYLLKELILCLKIIDGNLLIILLSLFVYCSSGTNFTSKTANPSKFELGLNDTSCNNFKQNITQK